MGHKRLDKPGTTNWIVVDRFGNIHARIHNADYGGALSIARTAFPEFAEGELKVIHGTRASHAWRVASKETPILTPARCAAQGITWSPLIEWRTQLQHHFAHVKPVKEEDSRLGPRPKARAAGGGQ